MVICVLHFALQTHIYECAHTSVKCVHSQCTAEVKRSLLAKHLEEECLYRTVQCENCHETLAFASLEVGPESEFKSQLIIVRQTNI